MLVAQRYLPLAAQLGQLAEPFLALAQQTKQGNVILISALDSSEEFAGISKNAFAVGVYDESIGFAIADYLNKKNTAEIGLITNLQDPFTLLEKNAFKEKYKGKIQEENYTADTKDFRSILAKMASQENLVLLGWEETGRIVKQAAELGMKKQIIGID
ncbi:MAG: hypothetical protein UY35_C0037G0012, partial [Candidatus Saccharibacteria bacterium GW2011_GWC2_48_9]